MSFSLHWPLREHIDAAGYSTVAHVPFVLRDLSKYDVPASAYLRDRALLRFVPGVAIEGGVDMARYPTRQSLITFGSSITNFLEWCDERKLDWRDLEYTFDLVEGYQAEMLRGSWSASGKGLSAQTVNMRLREAVHFLDWAAQRGLRKPFDVIGKKIAFVAPTHRNAHGHLLKHTETRAGRVRPDPRTLRLPSEAEISAWQRAIEVQRGESKLLMIKLILDTGIRREECCQWRVDTLPLLRSDWAVIGQTVSVTIRYGTKGSKYPDDTGEVRGPSRVVVFPVELAEKIHAYREFVRPGNRSLHVKGASTLVERRARRDTDPRQLFLSDFNGRPIQAHSLYEAWTSVRNVPFEGWSPHGGRHYWACKTLLRAVKRQADAVGIAVNAASSNWITGCVNDALLLEVKPQLGHVDVKTSELYLAWVARAYQQTLQSDDYAAALEASD